MAYQLEDINFRTVSDPKGFVEESDAQYQQKVEKAAALISENCAKSPIVLLSGPSGSGKTTTAMKIAGELNRRGIGTHYIGMDDYFKTIDDNSPRTPEGELDLESPLCLDMELMNRHFDMLSKGERIYVPKYEFARRMRSLTPSKSIQLKKDEVVIVEGILIFQDPTLRDMFDIKIFVETDADVRILRRALRDIRDRGRTLESVITQYLTTVKPMHEQYVEPSRKYADIIVLEGGHNLVALDMIMQRIASHIASED